MMRKALATLLCGHAILGVGCKSISSTFVQRMDNDRLVGNSNGETGLHDNAKPFKGLPVTVPVLTHVDITISEEIFLDQKTLEPIRTNRRNFRATPTPFHSDKIFAVDPKKAASGTSEYNLEMNSEGLLEDRQYFKSIKQDVDDTTIKDVEAVLSDLLPKLVTKQSAPIEKSLVNNQGEFLSIERHVAWKRFDIGAPDFQEQVRAFVEHHLNNCNSCGESGMCGVPQPAISIQPSIDFVAPPVVNK